ncbi:MAG: hypothetical protein L6V81_05600 [Clostridium sp.]|nr:MAG: hypothetical protein L6V81_05600 [Clostridium sp.]
MSKNEEVFNIYINNYIYNWWSLFIQKNNNKKENHNDNSNDGENKTTETIKRY